MSKLCPKSLGMAGGILYGMCMLIFTILACQTGFAMHWMAQMTEIYPGYSVTMVGSLVGLIYGFVDGFICLFFLAWIYNKVQP